MSFLPLFLQEATGAAATGSATTTGLAAVQFLPFIAILVIMYFLMIRPQSKKQKETQAMLDALKKGDKVVTIGGIHGTVSSVKNDVVVVKVDDNAKIEFNRTAIATVLNKQAPATGKKGAEKKEETSNSDAEEESDE